eukprot:EG_transcript_30290
MLGLLGAGWGAAAALSSGLARQLRFKAKASGRSLSRTYNNRRPKRMGLKAGHGELVEEQTMLAKQRKIKWLAGDGTFFGRTRNLHAGQAGVVEFRRSDSPTKSQAVATISPYWKEHRALQRLKATLGQWGALPDHCRGRVLTGGPGLGVYVAGVQGPRRPTGTA